MTPRSVSRSTRRLVAAFLVLLTASVGGFLTARAVADQPHMQAALEHLHAAGHQLEVAEADKGGHRAKAIRLVNEAITQVDKGIQFDRNH
jgi:hypothetical protein